MFSALFSGSKNTSSSKANSKPSASRPSFSSRRGTSKTTTETIVSRHTKDVNTPSGSYSRQGSYFGDRPRTRERTPRVSTEGRHRKDSLDRTATENAIPKLRTRPSSPLLGERYRGTSHASGSAVGSKPHTVQTGGSNSSIDTHYDAQKSPLSISQQTSASAARDYNVKRGIVPTAPVTEQRNQSNLRGGYHVDNQSLQSNKNNKSRTSALKPRHVDLSSLFPKPAIAKGSLLSPQRSDQSPSQFSRSTLHPSSLQISGGSTSRSIGKSVKASRQHSQAKERTPQAPSKHIVTTVGSKKLKPRIENWFDGPEGNVSDDGEMLFGPGPDIETSPPAPQNAQKALTSKSGDRSSMTSGHSQSFLTGLAPSYVSAPRRSRTSSARLPSDSNSFRFPAQPLTRPNPDYRRQAAMSMSSKRSKASTFEQANLMKESVLSMSSSDEESDAEGSISSRSHNSIVSSYVQGLSAQAARNRLEGVAPGTDRGETPVSLQHSKLINEDRTISSGRSGSPTFLNHEFHSSQVIHGDYGDDSKTKISVRAHQHGQNTPSAWRPVGMRMNSVRSHASSSRASTLTLEPSLLRKPSQTSSVRTMTVTREEEALLEAIRQKKGSMRSDTYDVKKAPLDTPYIYDIAYTGGQRRKGMKALEPPREDMPRKSVDKIVNQKLKTTGDHPLKSTLYLSSSEASSPDQGHFPESRQSSIVPSVLGPSPTADSHDSQSPVTPPRSTLNDELPPLRITSLRPIDPAVQLAGGAQSRTLASDFWKFNDPDAEGTDHIHDLSEWAFPGIGSGRGNIAVVT
ncbi:MAG: hypothetical protein Q9160_004789 [Pyrenula sp. 1 TL-2023]